MMYIQANLLFLQDHVALVTHADRLREPGLQQWESLAGAAVAEDATALAAVMLWWDCTLLSARCTVGTAQAQQTQVRYGCSVPGGELA